VPFFIVGFIVLLDQITKYIATILLKSQASFPLIEDVFHFTYHENRGAFLGIFSDQRWIFLSLSTIAIVLMILYLVKNKNEPKLLTISLSFFIGGGIGNMIDRILLGYVIDFLDFTLINFPIFNVADSFVTIGACLFIFYILKYEFAKTPKKNKNNIAENEDE